MKPIPNLLAALTSAGIANELPGQIFPKPATGVLNHDRRRRYGLEVRK
jgi:hypothetical protein